MDKVILRKTLLEKRRALSPAETAEKSQAIFENLKDLEEYRTAESVLVYSAFDGETATQVIISDLEHRNVRIYLPVIISDIEFVPCRMVGQLMKNRYGIHEPIPMETAVKGSGKIDLAICPGVGFDRDGHRLGYGKGYYDRYLNGEDIVKIGLAYELQVMEAIPFDEQDVLMDVVVTEKAVYRSCG